MKQLLILGNPVDGYRHIGPFESHEAACDWLEEQEHDLERDWWTVDLEEPV